uniref:exodeoxyribonuclease III n=1 Tax=Salarias fasciatus TaxID=181472 RepID=A0A672HB23_SALFA
MSIELCSLNAMFLFCKGVKANFILLQETHSVKDDEKFWKQQWGDNILFTHGTSHSAGVMILFYRFAGKIIDYKSDGNGHWIMVVFEIFDFKFIVINIYGYNNRSLNRSMMSKLSRDISEWSELYRTSNIITGGDFNIAPNSWMDRKPPKGLQPNIDDTFSSFCLANHLVDYWRETNPNSKTYTWMSPADTNLCSRLDYWLLNHVHPFSHDDCANTSEVLDSGVSKMHWSGWEKILHSPQTNASGERTV